MPTNVSPIPEGYHSATPYLIVRGAARAIDFYKHAFGAQEMLRFDGPAGSISHAEIKIGDSIIMLADERPEGGINGPQSLGGSSVSIMLYVADAAMTFEKAVAAGSKVTRPLKDQFYGDRIGGIEDPFGHLWYIATHIEDVPLDEMQRRAAAQG